MFDPAPYLRTERYGRSFVHLESTASTNDDARAAAADGAPDGHTIVADEQTSGRGAQGRAWSSPRGTDLYFSIVARTTLAVSALPPITLAVGLGVADVLEESLPQALIRVKWPNDVLVDDQKACGVLIETVSVGIDVASAVIGVGLNVNRQHFDEELEGKATSMALCAGRAFDRVEMLASVLHRIETRVDRFLVNGASSVVDDLNKRLAWRGERVRCGDVTGELRGVADDGAIEIVVNDELTRSVRAGRLERA